MNHFKIKHHAVEIEPSDENLKALPTRFLTILKNSNELLDVTRVKDGNLKVFDSNGKRELDCKTFLELWSGIVVLIETTDSNKSGYPRKSKKFKLIISIALLIAPIIYFLGQNLNFQNFIQFAFALIGLIVALLIKKSESGSGPAVLEKFCAAIKSFDCHAVTQSSGSKLFGKIDMATLSFIYFSSIILFLFIDGINQLNNHVLALLYILAIPITIYSIFYQNLVVKKWCPLCLATVLIIWLQVFFSLDMITNELISKIELDSLIVLLGSILFASSLWYLSKPIYDELVENKATIKELLRFKKNFPLFASAVQNVNPIETSISHSEKEIVLGAPDALIEILLITNPLCKFCSSAHTEIDELLERFREKIKVRIRFNVQTTTNAIAYQISNSLIQIYHECNKEYFSNALDDAFSSGTVKTDEWIRIYSKDSSPETDKVLDDQLSWCRKNGINFTPAFFINSKKIPEPYEIKDIKYFIDDLYEVLQEQEVLEPLNH
ncbi:vitamin K epoxide reductase family protein [Flagellimonas ochracea]|uniref:vitamin K epoxide reductase family protein n=1 Tax=Flagellimonas ochracea TaxID=2696472 RepID=UPI001412316C|nr:vitamin K epoxide reductase family protein [Allomuricauda ochracea]